MPRSSQRTKLTRSELLNSVNGFLETNYCSMREFRDGIAFAQILHACCPDQIPLYKLNFDAITKAQALGNLLILDEALKSAGLYKSVQRQKIAAGSALENYHFLNWCWGFMTNKYNHVRKTYRAVEWRNAFQGKRRTCQESSVNGHPHEETEGPNREILSFCETLETDIKTRLSALKTTTDQLKQFQNYRDVLFNELLTLEDACTKNESTKVTKRLLGCLHEAVHSLLTSK